MSLSVPSSLCRTCRRVHAGRVRRGPVGSRRPRRARRILRRGAVAEGVRARGRHPAPVAGTCAGVGGVTCHAESLCGVCAIQKQRSCQASISIGGFVGPEVP